MSWFDELHKRVEREGQRPHVLRAGGGRLLVVEHGARVLACELPGVDHNLFFHTGETPDGKITGGDRLWIAPEVAYFWPSLDDALRDPKGTAETPGQIDPAKYQGVLDPEANGFFELGTDMLVHDRRTTRSGNLIVDRSVRAATELDITGDLRRLSFAIDNSLLMQAVSDERLCAGAWSILQVPPTGTLICPVTRRLDGGDDIRSYYDPFGDRHVVADERCVRFLIDGQRRIKMGIKPEHTTGRMAFYRRLEGDTSSLIVRIFASLPGEPYCDLPRDDPRHRQLARGEIEGPVLGGDCLQAYNDDGDAFGGGPEVTFGEMEYHDPCVIVGRGPASRAGLCATHVVAGPDDAVRAFGEELLGVPVTAID